MIHGNSNIKVLLTLRLTPTSRIINLPDVRHYLYQYVRNYPPYLEAVCSIRNLRTCHDAMAKNQLNIRGYEHE